MTTGSKPALHRRPVFWGTLLFASFAIIAALRISSAIDSVTGFILMAASMGLMIPLVRCISAQQKRSGTMSPAVVNYTRGIMLSSFAYAVGLGIAVRLNDQMELTGLVAFAVALLPVIPTLGMVYTMGKYLVSEQDEYLRHRAMIANIVGLGAVLAIGSFWGFLETFGLVPHVPGWWAVPIWAIGMGLGQAAMSVRDRKGGEA